MKKIIIGTLSLTLILLVLAYTLAFTSFGNNLLKPTIQAKINESSPLPIELSEFTLNMSSFKILLKLDHENTILAEGTYSLGEDIAKLAFVPVGATISVVGRSIESLGLSLYYSSSIGIKIISPTVEAGFLTGLGVLSLGSSALSYVGGKTLGVLNQIGTTVVSPVAAIGKTVAT